MSNCLNICFIPLISSFVSVFAIANMPTFLNLFMSVNFFMRFITTLSSGVSGASPSSRTHGWFKISSALMRSAGF